MHRRGMRLADGGSGLTRGVNVKFHSEFRRLA